MTDNIVTDETTRSLKFGPEPKQVARFIEHRAPPGGAERANFPSFVHNLCDVLSVPHPELTIPDVSENAYVFKRDVTFQNQDDSTRETELAEQFSIQVVTGWIGNPHVSR